ncbi:hypothetical protein ACN2LU_004364 [Vibrio vulnificus]|nr:hypothetical protein [Vibrio vulnificus]EHZ2756350.1 hypothetical protein [Vibrio vulnificus]EHZ2765423.1 hypothetical protein [Vibrio vulnificus]EIV8493031.1 hypothetical protein [Vibrio vulnificus]EKD8805207.1 hypothetical protein [Vibrio vulnificus]
MKFLLSVLIILLGCNFVLTLVQGSLDNATSLLIGVSSSLIATGIFVIATDVFQRKVLPWYGDKVYRGCRIDGDWVVSGSNYEQRLELTQFGDEIHGVYSHVSDGEKDTYLLKGLIKESYLSATAHPKSQRHIDSIVFLLKVDIQDGKYIMRGARLSIGDESEVGHDDSLLFEWKPS